MWDFEIWFEEIRSVFPMNVRHGWINERSYYYSAIATNSAMYPPVLKWKHQEWQSTKKKTLKATAKNGKLNKKKAEPGPRERENERNVYISYVCCMLKCTLHKYIWYVECVHSIFGTFKIDRRDVFSTRYKNGLFDRPQKKRRADRWTAHKTVKRVAPLIEAHSENKQFAGEKRYTEGWTRSRTSEYVRSGTHTHIHFVCIKKKCVYEWRNQFGYLELIINSQI